MPPRASWKGFLQLSLVSVPVQGFTAASSADSPIRLNQLHADCHERIRYQKTCPVHGEVPSHEIVMGYEYERDHYVVIDPDELDRLRTERDRAVNVQAFVPEHSVGPMYFSGRTYYLLPDGAHAERPYALVQQAMSDEGLWGIAQVVISKREQLVAIRPTENLLSMSILIYANELRTPAVFDDQYSAPELKPAELKLTRQLLQGLTQEDLDLKDFRDLYEDRLRELVAAKMEGRELVAPRETAPKPVVNLMDALKASLQDVKTPRAKAAVKSSAARRIAKQRTEHVRSTVKRKGRKSG